MNDRRIVLGIIAIIAGLALAIGEFANSHPWQTGFWIGAAAILTGIWVLTDHQRPVTVEAGLVPWRVEARVPMDEHHGIQVQGVFGGRIGADVAISDLAFSFDVDRDEVVVLGIVVASSRDQATRVLKRSIEKTGLMVEAVRAWEVRP